MRLVYLLMTMTVAAIFLVSVGCGGDSGPQLADAPPPNDSGARQTRDDRTTNADANAEATRRLADRSGSDAEGRGEVVAILNDRSIRWADLHELMIEAAGADALSEWAMDRQLNDALAEAGLEITDADIDREKQLLLEQLSDDPDEAVLLLERVREQRGLGPQRFRLLLRRNAGLRQLVADRVEVTDAMVEQLYRQRFGERTVARLILVETIGEAARVNRRVEAGESFVDLAVEVSIDPSGSRGGLLPEISPDDPTFPSAIRDALADLEPGEVSDPVAVDDGFAVLLAERKVAADDSVELDEVADELRDEVRRRNEQAAMQQRARVLLDEADLSVLDSQLDRTWERRRRTILDQQ